MILDGDTELKCWRCALKEDKPRNSGDNSVQWRLHSTNRKGEGGRKRRREREEESERRRGREEGGMEGETQ